MRVTNRLILNSEKRSFWRASFKVFSFTIISLPQKSEKRNKITNKFRKACGFKIFENWHLLFTLKVGCCWFFKSIARLVNSFRTQDSLFATNKYPDFREGRDEEAIKRRLKIFQTKTLKRKNNTVTGNCSAYSSN